MVDVNVKVSEGIGTVREGCGDGGGGGDGGDGGSGDNTKLWRHGQGSYNMEEEE